MMKHNQDGAISGVVVSLVLAVVLLIAAIIFGGWAYSSRQDYKNNTDQKIAAAVTAAKQQQSSKDQATYQQEAKYPLRTYSGPEAYGSLAVQFPKTWSAMVDDTGTNSTALVDGYFYPNVVPATTSASNKTGASFALRIQVLNQSYATTLQSLTQNQQSTQPGQPVTTINPYALPKLPKVVGVEVNGTLPNQKTGIMVVLPLRSETLEVWTEGTQFVSDFDNIILPNFSFSP